MAEIKRKLEVAGMEEAQVERPTLASRIADVAAAQLLTFDELPEDERPGGGDRALLVGIVWGGTTLVELEQVGKGGDLTVSRLFDLPGSTLPKDFRLVKHLQSGHVVTFPDELRAEVHCGGRAVPVAIKGQRVDAPFRGHAYTIGRDDRVVAQITPSLTLIARYVRAERRKDKPLLERIDVPFVATVLIALLALLVFLRFVGQMPRSEETYREALAQNPERFARYQVKAPPAPPEPPRVQEAPGAKEGERSSGAEGKAGKPEVKRKEAAPSRPGADPDKKAKDLTKIRKLGLIAALSKMGAAGGGPGLPGPGGLGAGINPSLGGARARAGVGDAYGVGGLGTRGTGPGGGGNALGIGGLGTRGSGHGRGGYGELDLGGRGKDDTVFLPGRTTVVGGLSREVINRVIQKHFNEIKYCYEKELPKNPELYGKVTVLFLIEGTGRVGDALVQQTTMASEPVESCMINHVRRWLFPAPQGGGTVQVTYPYVFKSGGR